MQITVRPADSFWYYSQLFDIPLILIERSNPNVAPNQLTIGQYIQIPGYRKRSYSIQSGDTLWNIATKHNIPLDMIYLINPTIDPVTLQVEQSIFIPERITHLLLTDFNNYTYEKMLSHIKLLQQHYPFIMSEVIGSSVMGKDLIELQIGTGMKAVHVNGSFHANEWITTPIIMRFLNEYVLSLTNRLPIRGMMMLPLYLETFLSLVPMVNPDGVNLVIEGVQSANNFTNEVLAINEQSEDFSNWKANIRGVDLNNQYPAEWEIEAGRKPTSPQPRDHPGPYPLSEPEAMAMADLTRRRQFVRVNAFHTQGKVIFWGFEGLEPNTSEVIVNEYARVSGYTPIRYVDSYAGYKDWFIQEFHRPGFTVELGEGVNPLPFEQFPSIYEQSLGILLANLYM